MAMNRHTAIIAIALVLLLAAPVTALSELNGNHYDYKLPYENKYASPPLTEEEQISATTGAYEVHITTAGCLDSDSRSFVIASFFDEYFSEEQTGINGVKDGRLESGRYLFRLAKGTGSSHDLNTWKAEEQEVTIIPGQKTIVTFIGSGGPCGGTLSEPEMVCPYIREAHMYDPLDTGYPFALFHVVNNLGYPYWITIRYTVQYDILPGTTKTGTWTTTQKIIRFAQMGKSAAWGAVPYGYRHTNEQLTAYDVISCRKMVYRF